MARRSHLEGRLLAVLDETRARGGIPTRVTAASLVVATLLWSGSAGLEPRLIAARAQVPAAPEPASILANASEGDTDADLGPESEHTLPASPGGRLDLELETGASVESRLGSARGERPFPARRPRLRPLAREGLARRKRSARPRLPEPQTGLVLHLSSLRDPGAFALRRARAFGRRRRQIVEVEDRSGNTGGGELLIERAKEPPQLSTGGGDINVSDSELGGSVSTGGGMVRLSRVRGGLRGSSGSGPVIYSGTTRLGRR